MERKNVDKGFVPTKACPRCGGPQLKMWSELSADDKFVFERRTRDSDSLKALAKKLFCTSCLYVDEEYSSNLA